MAPTLTVDSFLDVVQRSRLLSAEDLQETIRDLEPQGVSFDSPATAAAELVRRGLVTRWQADHLLQGKHKGFFLGPYRLLDVLGLGGMGAVYLARHEMLRRRCAIKVLPTRMLKRKSSVLERFYLEAQAVASLDHPNIVRAYDVNKEVRGKNEVHYLVMEYIEGRDLQILVQERGRGLDYLQVADYARQTACGLAHAHEHGLIHRDIKPANLMVDVKGAVKILDLGLARFFEDPSGASLTVAYNESVLGTADYLSPEQALNSHSVDARTDVYSLGCTCYFMLTGQPPFPEGTVAQRLMAHQRKPPRSIRSHRSDAPQDLVAIIDTMMAKKPEHRYQTATEVEQAFRQWLVAHADEAWKQQHRDVIAEGSGAASRAHEPTRAKSSPIEDTGVDLPPPHAQEEQPRDTRKTAAEFAASRHAPAPPRERLAPAGRATDRSPGSGDAVPVVPAGSPPPASDSGSRKAQEMSSPRPIAPSGRGEGEAATQWGCYPVRVAAATARQESAPPAAMPNKGLPWLRLIGFAAGALLAAAVLFFSFFRP